MASLISSTPKMTSPNPAHTTRAAPPTATSSSSSTRGSTTASLMARCSRSSALSSCSALISSSSSSSSSSLRKAVGGMGSSSRSLLAAPKGLGQNLKPAPLSLPLPTTLPSSLPSLYTPSLRTRSPHTPSHVAQAGRGGDDDTVDATQRILASVGYILPFLDGAKYGRYLYLQYPFVRAVLDPVVPAIQLYNGLPFAGFIAFFALYLGIIQNQGMSRYVRYNVMQAVILDILMILPALLERVFTFRDGVGFQITIVCYNTVFLYLVACVMFGIGSCLLGRNPRLPLVADAAEAQVPF